MKENKKNRGLNILSIVIGILLLIMTISLIILFKDINIIPENYFKIGVIIISIVTCLLELFLFIPFKNKVLKIFKIIMMIVTILLIFAYSIGVYYLNKTMHLFDNMGIITEEVTDYYIIVLDTSIYQETSDLYQKSLAYYDGTDEEVINSIKLELSYSIEKDIIEIKNKLYNGQVESILISDIVKNRLEEDDSNFENNIRILETISIKKQIEDITKRVSIKNTPYNVLISGIDTYGSITKRSRNDVNIVATVNPNTNEILLTSIPRDYYVQIHGKSGLKDKLTHASYYGINTAVQTIEDLLEIDINYYIKVNFSTVVELVDEIGGIEIYADQSVRLSHCNISKGYNTVNGECALAFSRERYQYSDGDRHRGRNQQEVIKGIFNKLTSGTTMITKYTNILEVMDGKFATSMDINEVTDFIKYEVNDLGNYTILTTQLDGYGSMGETYSYPGQSLWIMIPYQKTIDNAKNLINKMLNNESIK